MDSTAPEASRGELAGPDVALLIDLLKLGTFIAAPMREGVADPLGLTTTDLRIVLALGGEGELAGHELSEIMGLAPMNVSRALSALSRRGIVEPGVDETNRRRKPVRLSAQGRAVFDDALATMGGVARHLFGGLSARDRAVFARAAQSILTRMMAWPDAPGRP